MLGKFGLVWSRAIFTRLETGQSGPRCNFWDRDRDCLDQSDPGPDLVQMVPGGKFILGHLDAVRGSRGGWGEVVGQRGLASNLSFTSSALRLFSTICRNQRSVVGQRRWGRGGVR